MIKAVMIYGFRNGMQDRLERKLFDQEIPVISHSIQKFGWKARVLESLKIAKDNPDDILIFLDAWDMLMLGTRQELETLSLDEGITFAAQKFCYPHENRKPEYDAIQPKDVGQWRFINSNPMAGLGRNIAAAIEWGWERFPIKYNTNVTHMYFDNIDERFLTDLYLSEARDKFNIKLDTRCQLNQIFLASIEGDLWLDAGKRRVFNVPHETYPVFIHFNGHSNPPEALL